jgi:hypothetical protein
VGRLWSRMVRPLERGRAAPRIAGYPTSPNRASSLHLRWELPAGAGAVVAASAALVVETTPPVPDLYFWALQASFIDRANRHCGGGHVGLQWHWQHPGSRAVNWGGYGPDGRVLDGSPSPLPSATDNPHTRDLWWDPGQSYTLSIERAAEGGWVGAVGGVRLRTLAADGDRLDALMVWSEVFAPCDAPPVAVRWSGFRATTAPGRVVAPVAVHVNYQRHEDGGCDNSTALADGDAVRQITGTERSVPQGTRLPLGTPRQ